MDYTNIKCPSEQCKDKNIKMNCDGGCSSGRINYGNVKCPVCGLKIMIMPLLDKYNYSISVKTDDEIKERKSKKERMIAIENELEVLKRELLE